MNTQFEHYAKVCEANGQNFSIYSYCLSKFAEYLDAERAANKQIVEDLKVAGVPVHFLNGSEASRLLESDPNFVRQNLLLPVGSELAIIDGNHAVSFPLPAVLAGAAKKYSITEKANSGDEFEMTGFVLLYAAIQAEKRKELEQHAEKNVGAA